MFGSFPGNSIFLGSFYRDQGPGFPKARDRAAKEMQSIDLRSLKQILTDKYTKRVKGFEIRGPSLVGREGLEIGPFLLCETEGNYEARFGPVLGWRAQEIMNAAEDAHVRNTLLRESIFENAKEHARQELVEDRADRKKACPPRKARLDESFEPRYECVCIVLCEDSTNTFEGRGLHITRQAVEIELHKHLLMG